MKAILAVAVWIAMASAQTLSVRVDVVNVNVIVKSESNQPVSGLQQADFILEEEGRPQKIKYFSRESELPLTLGLLVDVSDSMRAHLAKEQEASAVFLQQMLGPKDEAFIIRFGTEVDVIQPQTASLDKLRSALKQLKRPGTLFKSGIPRRCRGFSNTPLYDAIAEGAQQIRTVSHGRKALIVLTDGLDHNSCASLKTVIEKALAADAIVYVVLYAPKDIKREMYEKYREALNKIAFFTGGDIYDAGSAPIEAIYATIAQELRQVYSLGYSSDQSTEKVEYRRIRVKVREPGATVVARDGYFAGAKKELKK